MMDGRLRDARRLKQLRGEFGAGIGRDHPLAITAASLSLQVERLQDKSDRGEEIHAAALAQLVEARSKVIRQIGALRRSLAAPAAGAGGKRAVGQMNEYGDHDGAYPKEPPVGHSSWLRRHLHRMRWLQRRCVAEPGLDPEILRLVSGGGMGVQSALSPERMHELKIQYRKLELDGAFLNEAH